MYLKKIFTALNKIIPKTNLVLFSSYPSYSDNAMALYEYILNNRSDILDNYQLVWGQDNVMDDIPLMVKQSKSYIEKKSFKGMWMFLRARYIIATHDYFSDVFPGSYQKQINLWHGNGYKDIPKADKAYRGDYTIATGKIYKSIQAKVFEIPEENVWVSGLPRNDELFSSSDSLAKLGVDASKYNQIMLWLPTYRRAKLNHEDVDGNEFSFGIKDILGNSFEDLEKILAEQKILLMIKPHPMEKISNSKNKKSNNILFFTNDNMKKSGVNLYSLLAETDVLLSDYSSVVIDYLLLNRPIVMVCSDLDDYATNRGFVLNPIKEYMPGPIITNLSEFIKYMENYQAINSEWKQKRHYLQKIFHRFVDNRSSERVCNKIFGEEIIK